MYSIILGIIGCCFCTFFISQKSHFSVQKTARWSFLSDISIATCTINIRKMSISHILNIIFLILVNNLMVLSRKKEDKYVGHDKSNQTIGYHNYFPNSKESSEKILKGIWLVLGIFLLVASFLLFRLLYKASSVLCLRHQG